MAKTGHPAVHFSGRRNKYIKKLQVLATAYYCMFCRFMIVTV